MLPVLYKNSFVIEPITMELKKSWKKMSKFFIVNNVKNIDNFAKLFCIVI